MNGDITFLIRRPYQEIVDDLLTSLLGGVVNEQIRFDVKSDTYPLSQPARDVRSVAGTVSGQDAPHTFQKDVDFSFDAGRNAVVWLTGGTLPDDTTAFFVDYFPVSGVSPLTDINVGSVTRTLAEGIGREIATVYQEVLAAYLTGFVDTAGARSLDLVVSILGVTRMTGEFASGLVTFFGDPSATGSVTIPQGTQLRTTKGDAEFVTTEPRTLQQGQARVDVPVRAADAFRGPLGVVEAGTITVLAQRMDGIIRVTNLDPTALGAPDESDDDLRLRAKAALRGLGKATLAALAQAVFEERADLIEVWDPDSPTKRSGPGTVSILVGVEPKGFPGVQQRLQETKAAGVQLTALAKYVYVEPRVVAEVGASVPAAGKEKVAQDIISAVQAYVDKLGSGKPAVGKDMLSVIESVPDASNPKFVDVLAFTTALSPPTADLVQALVDAIPDPLSDRQALRAVFTEILGLGSAPSGELVPARGQVQNPAGQRATDQDIESANFQVSAVVQGDTWWIALKMDRSDVALRVAGG